MNTALMTARSQSAQTSTLRQSPVFGKLSFVNRQHHAFQHPFPGRTASLGQGAENVPALLHDALRPRHLGFKGWVIGYQAIPAGRFGEVNGVALFHLEALRGLSW